MFVRRKKNKSGVVSIQVIDKSSGQYRVVKTIGSSSNKKIAEKLFNEGELWIRKQQGLELDFDKTDDLFEHFIDGIKQISIIGMNFCLAGFSMTLGSIK